MNLQKILPSIAKPGNDAIATDSQQSEKLKESTHLLSSRKLPVQILSKPKSPQLASSSHQHIQNVTSSMASGSNSHITSLLNPSKSSASLSTITFPSQFNESGKPLSPTTRLSPPNQINTPQNVPPSQSNSSANSNPDSQIENDFDTENSNSNVDDSDNDSTRETTTTTTTTTTSNDAAHPKPPPRKRSKVSRACDECRRKKVKCDAVLDPSCNTIVKICTNCEKNKDTCQFTRVPLKRGPNKGFNKKPITSVISSSKKLVSKQQPRSRTNSLNSAKFEDGDNEPLKYPVPFPQTLPMAQMNPALQHQQIILPPLNTMQFPIINNAPMANNQQGIFWKVPSEMPNLSSSIGGSRRRKGSLDSTHSLSSNSSIGSNNKRANSFRSASRATIENSDSEDEFMNNISHRLSNSSFQVPFSISNLSPRQSFTNDSVGSRKDQRPSFSSVISGNSSISYQTNQTINPKIAPPKQTGNPTNPSKSINVIFDMLENYYNFLYPQYPLLSDMETIKVSVQNIIDSQECSIIIDIFTLSLHAFMLSDNESNGTLVVNFDDIQRAFQLSTQAYSIKSTFESSIHAKIILTSAFSLLNYGIILSHYTYSLGFGIAFSFYKDWLIFKEGYDSPCFINLIQLVVLDSLYTLYYGVPRSSTVCFAIDTGFINVFLIEAGYKGNAELEWLSIGLNLVVLNNNLQNLDSLDMLGSIEVTGTEFKFMSIIKLYYELFIYCRKMNIQSVIDEYKKSNSNDSLNESLKKDMIKIELEISKISKKITNLIDEQIDDLEVTKPNILISIVLIKCMRMLINIEILLKSIIHINGILDSSNNAFTKSIFSGSNDSTIKGTDNLSTRSRSDSNSSLMKLSLSTNLSDYNKRFEKMIENIQSNLVRSLKVNQTNQNCYQLMTELYNSKRFEINAPRTNNNKGIEFSVVIQNWIRLVNTFLAGEITKEGINGWCYL